MTKVPIDSSLQSQIASLLESYPAAIAAREAIGDKAHPVRSAMVGLRKSVERAMPVATRPALRCSYTIRKAELPARIELTCTDGWYSTDRMALWLAFSPNRPTFYIALFPDYDDQGDPSAAAWSDDDSVIESGDFEGYDRGYANVLSKFVPAVSQLRQRGFSLERELPSDADGSATAVEWDREGYLAWKSYSAEKLPGDTILLGDLEDAIEAIERGIVLDGGIVQTSGGRPHRTSPRNVARVRHPAAEHPDDLDRAEFDRMCTAFLSYYDDNFGDFSDRSGPYYEDERAYKDELVGRAHELLSRQLWESELSPARALAIVEATKRLLERPLATTGRPQNLLGWRYSAFLSKLDRSETALFARSLGELLYGAGEDAERVAAFNTATWATIKRTTGGNPFALSRILPTLLLMLVSPQNNIALRTDMFDAAARRLLGRRLFRDAPITALEYRDAVLFVNAIRRHLEAKAWRPRDLIDVHSFLWVTAHDSPDEQLLGSYEAPSDDHQTESEGH